MTTPQKPKTMSLPVLLREDELQAKLKELTGLILRAEELDVRLKSVTRSIKDESAKVAEQISALATVCDAGKENREVEVRETRNESARTIETIRLDLMEVVCSRPMTFLELQPSLFADESNSRVDETKADSDAPQVPFGEPEGDWEPEPFGPQPKPETPEEEPEPKPKKRRASKRTAEATA